MRRRPATTQSGLPFDAHLSRSERQQLLSTSLMPTAASPLWAVIRWAEDVAASVTLGGWYGFRGRAR